MPFQRIPLDKRTIEAEQNFRHHLRYLMKVADTNCCELANESGTTTSSILRYAKNDEINYVKFTAYSIALFCLADKHGRFREFMEAYKIDVSEDAPMTLPSLLPTIRNFYTSYSEDRNRSVERSF